jgi:hypothetical protein
VTSGRRPRPTDGAALDCALEAPCVVATGSDETITSIRTRLTSAQRFVAYGHRFSIALFGPETARDSASLREACEGIALDVARWDQSGCLSPVVVYLLDIEESTRHRIAHDVSEALEALSATLPRGTLSPDAKAQIATERAEARMRAASGRGLIFEGSQHTVVLESDARPKPAPLHRFLRLMPVDSPSALVDALAPFAGSLSNIAIAGFPPEPARSPLKRTSTDSLLTALQGRLSRLGISRFAKPGRLQTPPIDWPHDGMPLFTPLARFTRFTESNSFRE